MESWIKGFDAKEKSVSDLFSRKVEFSIPRNQREYCWTDRHWDELWYDLTEAISPSADWMDFNVKKDRFFGSLLFRELPNQKRGVAAYEVLDWQQRLTTLLIMLSVMYDQFSLIGEDGNRLKSVIYDYYHKKDDDGNEFFILVNEWLGNYFKSILFKSEDGDWEPVPAISKQEKIVKNAQEFFRSRFNADLERLEEMKRLPFLKAIRDGLLNFKVVEISVSSEVDWYAIFEILNARWKPLSLPDLVKNWLLKSLPTTFPIDVAKDRWDSIVSNVDVRDVWFTDPTDAYIKHYWIHKYEKFQDWDRVYYELKKKIWRDGVQEFLTDLHKKSSLYSKIVTAKLDDWNEIELFEPISLWLKKSILDSLSALKIFKVKQARPLLLSLVCAFEAWKINAAEFAKRLAAIENFHFIFSAICGESGNKVEKIYYDFSSALARDCSNSEFWKFVSALRLILPDKLTFKKYLSDKGYSNKDPELRKNKKIFDYMLKKIERHYLGGNELDISFATIEHIANDDGTLATCILGNLLPLWEAINNDAGNKNFVEKVEIYKESSLYSVANFLWKHSRLSDWNEVNITERQNELVDLAYDHIWTLAY